MIKNKLLVGTGKGLIEWEKIDRRWQITGVHFQGFPVSVIYVDEHTGVWWAAISHRHWGQKLHYSADQGNSWEGVEVPRFPEDAEFRPGKRASLRKIWCIQSAGADQPGALWVGTEPGGLFYRSGHEEPFELVRGLWDMPGRQDPTRWFGAGRDFPFIHSIVVNPEDSRHVYVAVSCAGVFETLDGGQHWRSRNKGLIAAYLPNPEAELGHDPHLLLACRSKPKVLWQQNHCGIFRSTDGAATWENVTDPAGLADYGFCLAVDHSNPERAWVIPAVSDEERVAAGLALTVCRTDDGGKSWQPLRKGLPPSYCFDIVFRHSLTIDSRQLAFGTTTGNLFYSDDFGESWSCLSHFLARVESISFA